MREKLLFQSLLIGIIAILLFASPDSSHFISSIIKPITEGNSPFKQFLFILFPLFLGIFKLVFDWQNAAMPKCLNKQNLSKLFLALVVIGFALNLLANLALFSFYGAPIDSYVAHVADCKNSTCWEASYIQHSHSLKPALYFLEKYLNLDLGSKTDSGKPMYDISPYPDMLSISTLGILGAIFLTSILLATLEKKYSSFFLLQFASVVSLIAILDGGIFTVAGINAIILVGLYFSNEKKYSKSPIFIAALLMHVYFIGAIVPKLLSTNLIFLDWFAPSVLLISFYMLATFKKSKLIGMRGIALLLFLYSGYFYLDYFNFVYSGETIDPNSKAVIYGFPNNYESDKILQSFSEPKLANFTRYGWYALIVLEKEGRLLEIVGKLKGQLNPPGYFLGEADYQSEQNASFRAIIRNFDDKILINAVSFKSPKEITCQKDCTFYGKSSLYATHLALEIASLLHSKGYDAVVITPVMWDYN